MTPIPLEVKQYMREFLEQELNMDAHKRTTIVTPSERQKSEAFLDAMWIFMNKRMLDQHEGGN